MADKNKGTSPNAGASRDRDSAGKKSPSGGRPADPPQVDRGWFGIK